jgi:hypothetical protein
MGGDAAMAAAGTAECLISAKALACETQHATKQMRYT